ncbi:interleukin-17 receptor E-like [Arapaima gigas]
MKFSGLLVFVVSGVLSQSDHIERISQCGTQCPKVPPDVKCHFSLHPCKNTPEPLGAPVFHNVSISTVMKCEEKQKCSLHLNIVTEMESSEHVQGVAVCVGPTGMLEQCKAIYFRRKGRKQLGGGQVKVRNDCYKVRASQEVRVVLRTIPEYCDLTWSRLYQCNNEDLRNNVPECITGKIVHTVDTERKELSVTVLGALEDKDYHLRLCYRAYTCSGTEDHVLIKKENPFKNATFHYSRLLPCLCIEGWSHMIDAPRVQVCPFRNNTQELWSGMSFDIGREILSWEPSCPTDAVITLCQKVDENLCLDLENSSQVTHGEKVTYSKVDPHPKLCMKFTTRNGAWIRCPFVSGKFPMWDLMVATSAGQHQAVLTSESRNQLSLSVCREGEAFACTDITTVTVDKWNHTIISLPADACDPSVCLQVKRVDVQFSTPVLQCHLPCLDRDPALWDVEQMLFLGVMCLMAVVIVALAANIVLTGFYNFPAHCPNGMVVLLHTREDDAHAQPLRNLEKFLTNLNMPVQLTDLDKGLAEQTLYADAITILLWSKGCNRHIERLRRGNSWSPSPKVDSPTSAVIWFDIAVYDICTGASGEVPSWLNAISLDQVKHIFAQAYRSTKAPHENLLFTFRSSYNTHIQSPSPNTLHSENSEKANLLGFST